jgi:Domain of unknown function (DUF3598)
MNEREQNWTNLFDEYTSNEIAWHGIWTVYSPEKEIIKSDRAIRIFRANEDTTIVTHINRYIRPDGSHDEKIWHLDKEKCNLPDGVVHPAMPFMRALSFGKGATAWLSPKLVFGKNFGAEFFFRYGNWRTSVAIVYGENGKLNRIVQINEHLGSFVDPLPIQEITTISGNWIGEKQSMTPDLKISSPETIQQWMFDATEAISLPNGVVLIVPQTVQVGESFAIAATKQVAENEFKRLTAQYDNSGAFALLVSEVLHLV